MVGLQVFRITTLQLNTGVVERTLMRTVSPAQQKIQLLIRIVIFPSVLKEVCHSVILQVEEFFLNEMFAQPSDAMEDIPEDLFQAHALTSKIGEKYSVIS